MQSFAKDLVKISIGADGHLDEVRVGAVLRVLGETTAHGLKSTLVAYLRELEKFVAATTVYLEHCGELSAGAAESLLAHFEGMLGRRLLITVVENDTLIAGLRVSVDDLVVEYSVAGTLEAYRRAITEADRPQGSVASTA
jgi:F0F1-type ATP synthase delta subunit